ncbi:MAG: hypothetical protein ACI4Q3_10765 [Kiritimatiellia bacterium]
MLAAFLGLAVCAARASTYTVALPDGATNTLSEAFANGYVTSDDGAATEEGLLAAADLRVTGGGRLEIDVDLKTAGFAGEVHVLPGAILRLTANGALGDTTSGTFVADGATLETECLDTTDNNKLAFAGERLSFAGTGVGGQGALIARTPVRQERNGVWGGTLLTMTGDALIATVTGYQDFPNNSSNNQLDMNGHTLTVTGVGNEQGRFVGGVCLRPVVVNPGHIVITNCGASINDNANLGGTAANTLTLAGYASLELYGYRTTGKKAWTLRIPSSNTHGVPLQSSSLGGVWDGPVVFERGMAIRCNPQINGDNSVNTNQSVFAGKITAMDAISFSTIYPDYKASNVTLASPENDFRGPVGVTNVNLRLAVNGALPNAVPSFAVSKSAIRIDTSLREDGSVQPFDLPVMQTEGPVTISDGPANFAGLDLRSGTTTFEEPARDFNAGLYEGWRAYAYWHKDPYGEFTEAMLLAYRANAHCDSADNNATNAVTLDVRLASEHQTFTDTVLNECGASVQAAGYAVNYQGYIWNPDSTNVTWTFAASENTVSTLWINGKGVYARQGVATSAGANADLQRGNAVLQPGANAFWWRIGVSGQTVGPKTAVKSCATWTDATKMGLVYDRLGRNSTNPDDYERLVNSADGSLFTLTVPGTAAYEALKAQMTCRLPLLRGATGTVLEARGRKLEIGELEGCPAVNVCGVRNRSVSGVTVTACLVAQTADVAAGRIFTTDGPLAFAASATVTLEGESKALAPNGIYTLATAEGGITGCPASEKGGIALSVSDDGKSLLARIIPAGTLIVFR